MPSRRDQVQSYQYFMQRVVSAFLVRDPNPQATPLRGLATAGFGSVLVAVICLAAVGIFGIVRPGGATSWKDGASVIVERETGTRYIYLDGKLHQVVNYSSALLAIGSHVSTQKVSRNSLVGTARGPRIGIPDAPDALPPAGRLLSGAWSLCTQPARNEAGAMVATSVLTVGKRPTGGQSPGDLGLLARDAKNNELYLIWHDHRYRVTSEKLVLESLVLGSEPIVKTAGAWLNALPAGEEIGPRQVADPGKPSTAFSGAVTGRVYRVKAPDGSAQYYLATKSELTPLTQLFASIVLSDPATQQAYGQTAPAASILAAAVAAAAPKTPTTASGPVQAPATTPKVVHLSGDRPPVCAEYPPGGGDPHVILQPSIAGVREPVKTTERTVDGTPLADQIDIEPGFGALVEAMPSRDAPAGTVNLITDIGIRYPMANEAVPSILGFVGVKPTRLPSSLVVRVPSGPSLDPDQAKRAVDSDPKSP